jgi:hypothetical protein
MLVVVKNQKTETMKEKLIDNLIALKEYIYENLLKLTSKLKMHSKEPVFKYALRSFLLFPVVILFSFVVFILMLLVWPFVPMIAYNIFNEEKI